MSGRRKMHIALSLNSKYMRYAYVMLTSLFESQPAHLEAHVYILHSDLTGEDKSQLEGLVKSYGGEICWCPVNEKLF